MLSRPSLIADRDRGGRSSRKRDRYAVGSEREHANVMHDRSIGWLGHRGAIIIVSPCWKNRRAGKTAGHRALARANARIWNAQGASATPDDIHEVLRARYKG